PAGDEPVVDLREERRREQPALHLVGVVVGLRVVAVELGHTAGREVLCQKALSVADGEAEVAEAALVAAPRGVADDDGEDIDAEVVVVASPDGALEEIAPVAAAEIDDERGRAAE